MTEVTGYTFRPGQRARYTTSYGRRAIEATVIRTINAEWIEVRTGYKTTPIRRVHVPGCRPQVIA